MTSYVTPKKNAAFKLYIGLRDQSNTKLFKANPTIASGDFKVSTDGAAFATLATLPSANPASGRAVMIDLSASEMNGDNIVVQCVDAAGAEWCDEIVNIQTTAQQIDDIPTAAAIASAVLTTAMTEAYAADGVAPTLAQMQFMVWSALAEFAISGSTITAKKLDGATTAMTFALDSSTAPTSRTRSA